MLNEKEIARLRRKNRVPASLARTLGALADERRLQIVKLLLPRHMICVTDVAGVLGVSVPAASMHLRLLEVAGLVNRVRHGQMVCYELRSAHPAVRAIARFLRET